MAQAVKLTVDERAMLDSALELAIASAARQQNTKGTMAEVKEAYAKREKALQGLKLKLDGQSELTI